MTDSGLVSEKFDGVSWESFMSARSVDYRGEEVRVARAFTWSNIEPALPPGIGSIPLEEVCGRGTLHYIQEFESYLLPEESQVYTKPPRVFVAEESWEQVCAGLLSKGLCRLIPQSEVFCVGHRHLHNGLYGVTKDEFTSDGVEIFRLIMNMVPLNRLCRNLGADVCTLPSVTSLGPVTLDQGEVLVMSSEDIKCFFYLFAVPVGWHKFLSFGRQVPASLVPGANQEPHYLTSLVLPMGFISSVAIAQHLHRRVARLSLHSMMDATLAAEIKGEPSAEALAMRDGYQFRGMPRHPKKSVEQQLQAEVQGALIDGVSGRVRPKPSKIMKYMDLALLLLNDGRASQKQMQIVSGGFVYCAMFRRPFLGMLNRVWSFIMSFEGEPPVIKHELPPWVKLEMTRFLCAL